MRARYITVQWGFSQQINRRAGNGTQAVAWPHRAAAIIVKSRGSTANERGSTANVRQRGECAAMPRALRPKVHWHPSVVPLLDTPKLVHIWYTTVTLVGWISLEFNRSSLVIGI